MEFKHFYLIFWSWNEKYTFYQKVYQTKFLDLIKAKNFLFLRFLGISHIVVKKLNHKFSILFFLIKKKIIHLLKKCCNSNL